MLVTVLSLIFLVMVMGWVCFVVFPPEDDGPRVPLDWLEHDMPEAFPTELQCCRRCGLSWFAGIREIGRCGPSTTMEDVEIPPLPLDDPVVAAHNTEMPVYRGVSLPDPPIAIVVEPSDLAGRKPKDGSK